MGPWDICLQDPQVDWCLESAETLVPAGTSVSVDGWSRRAGWAPGEWLSHAFRGLCPWAGSPQVLAASLSQDSGPGDQQQESCLGTSAHCALGVESRCCVLALFTVSLSPRLKAGLAAGVLRWCFTARGTAQGAHLSGPACEPSGVSRGALCKREP